MLRLKLNDVSKSSHWHGIIYINLEYFSQPNQDDGALTFSHECRAIYNLMPFDEKPKKLWLIIISNSLTGEMHGI